MNTKIRNCKMSAHDFQAKFASVMESILQGAIAETTKLFEAMVDELKADMSRIKKDNDDLKAKCSQFESVQKDAIAENSPSKKRHSAVQCDIISFCNKVAEQNLSHQETFYPLQEHDYDVSGNVRTVVRHESVSRQQEVNSAYSFGDFLHAECHRASQSETGSEGASTKTRRVPQERPDLGMYNSLQGGQKQEVRPPQDGPPTLAGCHGPPLNSAQIANVSQAPSLQPRKRYTSVTLQDARLLVEAMSSSVERGAFPSQQRMAAEPVCGPRVGAQQTADRALAGLRPHSRESSKAVHSLCIKEFVATESSQESVNVTEPSPTLVSAAATKVDTGKEQTAAAPDLSLGAPTTSSVPGKTPLNSPNMSLSVAEPTIIRGLPSGAQQHPRIKIGISAQQTVALVSEPDTSGEGADHSPSQEVNLVLESPDAVPPVSQVQKEYSESCSSLNSLAGVNLPAACHVKPFAVVRLTRLPFLMSTEESVLVSRLLSSAGWDGHSVLNQDTGSSRLSSGSSPAITPSNSGASSRSPSANIPQHEVTWETGQPIQQKTPSKDREKGSTSCTETGSNKMSMSQKGSFKAQPNCFKPHLEVGRTSHQHAETQTVSYKKLQRDQHDFKLDSAEIAQAVSPSRTSGDSSTKIRQPGLCHDVPEPPAPKDKDAVDDISSSQRGSTIQNTTLCPRPSSPVGSPKPGSRCSDAVTPGSPRQPGSDPGQPETALLVHRTGTPVPLGSSVEDSKTGSSGKRRNDGCDTKYKSTAFQKYRILQVETTPRMTLRVLNAKKRTKKAKVNLRKMKASNQLVQNRAKGTQLEANPPGDAVVKKIRSSGVWIPPVGDATANEPEQVCLKTETSSPRAPDRGALALQAAAVRAPPVVSPLQPLSLIGSRLLKNQCGVCGQVLGSTSALESHVSLHTRRPFSCRLCGKSFTDTKALKRHGRVHRNGKIHVCQKCGKAFVYKFSLTKHLQMVHRRIKPFVCQICNKSFFTKLDVESHIRIHTGEKPFHCNLCERKFIRRVDLNVHLRWHNGEKRHWCPYCKKGFLDFNNLKRHKYTHTGEKPHPCMHCPKQFTQSAHLKKHVKNVHKITGGS